MSKRKHASDEGLVDWFLARADTINLPRSPETRGYLDFLWPASQEYFSPLNSIFITGAVNLEALSSWPIWMARDGLVPLLWFFKRHPDPGGFRHKILVEETFSSYVPDAWRESVGTYRVVSTRSSQIESLIPRTRKFIITGLLMETYVSLGYLERQLRDAVDWVGADTFRKSEILAFLPPRPHGFGNDHQHEYYSECIFRIAKYLGTNVVSVPWSRFDSMDQLGEFEVLEFNEKLLCADSYLTYSVLHRGARLLQAPGSESLPGPRQQLLSLSPYHALLVTNVLRGKSMLQHPEEPAASVTLERFGEVMRSEANKRFPWPNWFQC